MTRDTRNRKTHDETPSNDKEQDVTFENIVGMENYQHQQLNELHDTVEAILTKFQTKQKKKNINQLANQIQMLTQVVARLETFLNWQSRARDSDHDGDNEQLRICSNNGRRGYHQSDETSGIDD